MRLFRCCYKPVDIQLHITSKCQLNCRSCARDIPYGYMDFESFKMIVDKCVDFGFRKFELTPTVGDLFLDENMCEKIEYLNTKDIDTIFFFTNLLAVNRELMLRLNDIEKLNIRISVYGENREQYRNNTGVDLYDTFVEKLGIVSSAARKGIISELNIRYDGWDEKKLRNIGNPLYRTIYKMVLEKLITLDDIIDESHNDNWIEVVTQDNSLDVYEERSDRNGVCRFSVISNSIHPDGDITLCGCIDTKKRMIIGNIFDQELEEIYGYDSLYHKIISEQHRNIFRGLCINCTMYDKFNRQHEYIHKE